MSGIIIEASDVNYEYPGKRALKDVSVTIREGSITALVGPNGAGKTTLMRCIAALDEPFSGTIRVSGCDTVQHPREVHRQIGYLSDFFGLYEGLTMRQSLMYVAGLHRIPPHAIAAEIASVAERLGLTALLDRAVTDMSRGQRQRVGIAQAILHRPKVLLLDEPAAGLDPEARAGLSKLFLSLRDEGMTLMVSSHILSELEDYCTEMLYLRDGRVLDHRQAKPQEAEAAELIIELSEPVLPGHSEKLAAQSGVSEVQAEGQALRCRFVGGKEARAGLIKALVNAGLPICGLQAQKKRLQDVYMELVTEDGHAPGA